MSTELKTLETLQAGDRVIYYFGRWQSTASVERVEKITATQIVVKGTRFRKATGRAVGDHYDRPRIKVGTEEEMQKVKAAYLQKVLSEKMKRHTWSEVPLPALRKIDEILKDLTPPQTEGREL